MKNTNYFLVFAVWCLTISSCKKNSCADFNAMHITGPSIVYIDSFFTLSVPYFDYVGYEWGHQSFTQSVTGENEITITDVGPQHSGSFNLVLYGGECGDRTISHVVEVRPKPFTASPCATANNTVKLSGMGTFSLTSIHPTTTYDPFYAVSADGPGCSVDIELGATAKPIYDQVWNIGNTADYHTAYVMIRAGSPFTCDLFPVGNTGKLYVKKITGGTEYSLCGVSFRDVGMCSGVTLTAELKFVLPD